MDEPSFFHTSATLISERVSRSPLLPRPNLTGPVGFAIEFRKTFWRFKRTFFSIFSRRIVLKNLHAPLTYRAHKVFYYKLKKKKPESIKRLAFTSPVDLSPKTDTRFSNTYAYFTPIIKVNRPIGPVFIP